MEIVNLENIKKPKIVIKKKNFCIFFLNKSLKKDLTIKEFDELLAVWINQI